MAEPVRIHVWRFWALLLGLAVASLFLRLLPLGVAPVGLPGPDLLLCLVFAWVLRRPEYVPALLVAAIFLLEDLILLRPPGLWALIVLLGTEFLRQRQPLMRELTFPMEWAMVSAVMLTMMLAERLTLAMTMVPTPSLRLSVVQLLMTVIAYPLVVLASHFLLRVRKPATGEVDALGRPI